jgi:type III pantothenate kinase
MNLVIDQGNTRCKIACFDNQGTLCYQISTPQPTLQALEALVKIYQPEAGILSSVLLHDSTLLEWLQRALPRFVSFTQHTPIPLKVSYKTPETLGLDRLAAAVGAWTFQPDKTLLIIDMGTAITYDLVSNEGVYLGGNIAPGLSMRLKSLHVYTGKLPLIQPDKRFEPFGTDTTSAIRAGVMQGIVYEVCGYVQTHRQTYHDLFAFLTGGDLIYFDENLKSGIFVDDNLVLTGLNAILNLHV